MEKGTCPHTTVIQAHVVVGPSKLLLTAAERAAVYQAAAVLVMRFSPVGPVVEANQKPAFFAPCALRLFAFSLAFTAEAA